MLQPPFLVCVVVLVGAALLAGPGAKWLKIRLRKDPVPLRKPLSQLDKTALGEYEFHRALTIDPAVLPTLGTETYIEWELVDTSVPSKEDPLRSVRLLVTYYTGKPNLVPHTPDVCYLGSGYAISEREDLRFQTDSLGALPPEVPVRAISFVRTAVRDRDEPTVVYTFHCNGEFMNARTDVRRKLSNPLAKGAYFCKIEVLFGGPRAEPRNPTRQESIQAAQKFFDRLLPVLIRDHLPDWEAVEGGEGAGQHVTQNAGGNAGGRKT